MTRPPPLRAVTGLALSGGSATRTPRDLPEETAVAITVNGSTLAVMMATPQDLADFATGFAVTEGVIAGPHEIDSLEIVPLPDGIEARLWVAAPRARALEDRRRAMAGPVGCGLCGIESLQAALRPLPRVTVPLRVTADEAASAPDLLEARQPLHGRAHALHAAGLLAPGAGVVLAREDVGRHNALDKLIGAALRGGLDPAAHAIVVTSRVSIELVQKAAIAGCPVLIAVSAPTAAALDAAEAAGLTLAAFARRGRLEVFTHPDRVVERDSHVA